ncbi:MAG: hypothetical protein ACLPYS_08370 [Vulcanimicrobiaceae bacterium]
MTGFSSVLLILRGAARRPAPKTVPAYVPTPAEPPPFKPWSIYFR